MSATGRIAGPRFMCSTPPPSTGWRSRREPPDEVSRGRRGGRAASRDRGSHRPGPEGAGRLQVPGGGRRALRPARVLRRCGRPGVERPDAGAAGMAADAEVRDDRGPRPYGLVGGVSPSPGLIVRPTISEGRHVYITPISRPGRKTKAYNPWNPRVKP